MNGRRDFLLFAAIGAFAAAVNVGARVLFSRWTGYEAAIALAFPVALVTAFVLNRLFVFRPEGGDWRGQLFRFLLVNLAALAQVFLVSLLLARILFPAIGMTLQPELVAHAIGVASPILTSYWAHRHFTFAPRRDPLALLEAP